MDEIKKAVTEEDIGRLVQSFYARVRKDDLLGPIFKSKISDDHWPKHMDHIQDFWSSVFLKTGRYTGNPLLKHAQLSGLTPEHFIHWLALFKDTAEKSLEPNISIEFITMANRIGLSLQMGLAFQHAQSGQADSPFKSFGIERWRAAMI